MSVTPEFEHSTEQKPDRYERPSLTVLATVAEVTHAANPGLNDGALFSAFISDQALKHHVVPVEPLRVLGAVAAVGL